MLESTIDVQRYIIDSGAGAPTTDMQWPDRIFATICMSRYIDIELETEKKEDSFPNPRRFVFFPIAYSSNVASKDASTAKWRSHPTNWARDVAIQPS
jgi:hypothetical protein